MKLTGIFSSVAKIGRGIAVLAVPMALTACATGALPSAQCMEGTRVEGPANLVSIQHYAVNEPCRDSFMNATLIQAGNDQNDTGLIAMGLMAQALQNPVYRDARETVANVIANPNAMLRCVAGTPEPGSTDVPLICETPMVIAPSAPQSAP